MAFVLLDSLCSLPRLSPKTVYRDFLYRYWLSVLVLLRRRKAKDLPQKTSLFMSKARNVVRLIAADHAGACILYVRFMYYSADTAAVRR